MHSQCVISRLLFGEQGIDQFRYCWPAWHVACGWAVDKCCVGGPHVSPQLNSADLSHLYIVTRMHGLLLWISLAFPWWLLKLSSFAYVYWPLVYPYFFKWLFKCFAHFSIGFSVFCLLKSRSYSNILNIILLLDICGWKKIFLKVLHPDNLRNKTMRINPVVLSMTMYGRFLSKGQREELGIYTWYLHSGLLRNKMPNSS